MRAAYRPSDGMLDTKPTSTHASAFPPSKRRFRRSLMTSLLTSHISIPHLPPSKAARWLVKQWSALMLSVCVAGFIGIAAFTLSLTDNYTCVGGAHVARAYESPWSIATQRCSGSHENAMRDIVSINGPAPYPVGMTVIVPLSGG